MKITLLLEYSASDGLTAHLRDFLMVAWLNVSPLAARRVTGPSSIWTAASILKIVG